MEDAIDTRKHYAVPMTITCKVQDEAEAVALCEAAAAFLVQRVKGVSMSHPPVVGTASELGTVALSADEVAAADALGAMLDDDDEATS